ncbi:MAG TPA: hypothetical protein VF595_11620 [Tepidisphaeraceae bacterium]
MTFAAFTDPPALPPGLPAGTVVVSAVVPGARSLDADGLTRATLDAYRTLRGKLHSAGDVYLIRVWNYVPALLTPTGPNTDRYMAFNAGRYSAMSEWFGPGRLAALAPAGTGVGHPGDDLVVHAWAAPTPGVAVQNPRQTPPVDYSARYGPRPPCFARATRVGRLLLVSGTAAITGEDTVAPGDLPAQLDVTLSHLRALAGDLSAYRSLRAYVPMPTDVAAVRDTLAARVPGVGWIEPIVTDLCRPELRVEIEGIAEENKPQ